MTDRTPGIPPTWSYRFKHSGVQFLDLEPADGCAGQMTPDDPVCTVTVVIKSFAPGPTDLTVLGYAGRTVTDVHHQGQFRDLVALRSGGQGSRQSARGASLHLTLPSGAVRRIDVRVATPTGHFQRSGAIEGWAYVRLRSAFNSHHFGPSYPVLTLPYDGYPCTSVYEDDEYCG